jgi:hypothetical protein
VIRRGTTVDGSRVDASKFTASADNQSRRRISERPSRRV